MCVNNPLSVWGSWSEERCPVTCGGATITRERDCRSQPNGKKTDAKLCSGMKEETMECNTAPCPGMYIVMHLKVSASLQILSLSVWSPWSDVVCPVSCGGGRFTRTRACKLGIDGDIIDTENCVGKDEEKVKCNEDDCPGLAIYFCNSLYASNGFISSQNGQAGSSPTLVQ